MLFSGNADQVQSPPLGDEESEAHSPDSTTPASVAESNVYSLAPKLSEGIAELAAPAHGHHVAILALGYRELERERALRVIALPRPEGGGGQDVALAVLDDDRGSSPDVGITAGAVAGGPSTEMAPTPASSVRTKTPDASTVSRMWNPSANCGQKASTANLSAITPCCAPPPSS